MKKIDIFSSKPFNQTWWWLTLVILLGVFLRGYQLGVLPTILNRDEAALAYNAYLLKEVGQDEWQRPWSIALESFGDYKLVGYVGALVGVFTILPLSDLAVRVPSFLAGIALIPLSFWFAQLMVGKPKFSLLIAFLVTTSPLFIFYSRMAFEANLAHSWFILAGCCFLAGNKYQAKTWWFDLVGLVATILAVITYNTPLLLLPFIIPVFPLVRGLHQPQRWWRQMGSLLFITALTFAVLLPLTQQKSGITIFSDETTWFNWIAHRETLSGPKLLILGNRYVYLASMVMQNVLDSFLPHFLVYEGGTHPWHSLPNWGHFYWLTYLFSLVGIVVASAHSFTYLKSLVSNQHFHMANQASGSVILLYLTLVSLVPSVITVDAPHATRSLFFMWLLIWWAGKGLLKTWEWVSEHYSARFVQVILIISLSMYLLELGCYTYRYFYLYPQHQPESLKIGYQAALAELDSEFGHQPVAIIDPEGFQYILTAWYLLLSPQKYFETSVRQLPDKIGFRYGERLKNYHFIVQPTDRSDSETVWLEWNGQRWIRHQ